MPKSTFETEPHSFCAIHRTLNVIGSKWTILILRDLFSGPKRFGELMKSLDGVSPKTLTIRLKELEEACVLTRIVFPEIPPHVEYELTDKGRSLLPIFEEMKIWGENWCK